MTLEEGNISTKVKVAVRVRPMNKRELDMGTDLIIDMVDNQVILSNPNAKSAEERKTPKTFAFDHSFWSIDEKDPKFVNQEMVFEHLGTDVLENAFDGYNACIFAYGQTGSGKSYTMMGTSSQRGLIPRICDSIFERIAAMNQTNLLVKLEVSYMEIYNEKVRDLLCPTSDKQNLKVREHQLLGPYVDGLSKLIVTSYEDIENLLLEGNKSRTVAATSMNAESSRSHAVFTIMLTQSVYDDALKASGEKNSKISLVDLAGSERVSKTGAAGERLKEGSNINKSLTMLGLVISALADQSNKKSRKSAFIPYRDSVLTWLLKDNLGGNSKTVMVATVSPAGDNYEETLSTLRYADRAKRIENHAVVNECPSAKLIRELREEVERLKSQLEAATYQGRASIERGNLKAQLEESEKLMNECSLTYEERVQKTQIIHKERQQILEDMGISVQTSGIGVEKNKFYLVNLNADPALNELLVYYLKERTLIGRPDAPTPMDIQLSGLGIQREHCILDVADDSVFITPFPSARTLVNGQVISERTALRHGDRLLWGNHHFFRINCPHRADQPAPAEGMEVDFQYAQNETVVNDVGFLGEPVKEVIRQIETRHEKEKQGALEKQKQMYESKLEEMRREMSPSADRPGSIGSSGYMSRLSHSTLMDGSLSDLTESREGAYNEFLQKLREDIVQGNLLVREANELSMEMNKGVDFAVTLQIPTSYLSPSRFRASQSSEVAIAVRHKTRGSQVWSVEKLRNKLFEMREMYQLRVLNHHSEQDNTFDGDLFFEVECHTLIGVTSVCLECLDHNVPLEYIAKIISQQGEVCGSLKVEIRRLSATVRQSSTESLEYLEDNLVIGSTVQVEVKVIEATGLPPLLSNYVFCQYQFLDEPLTVVAPVSNTGLEGGSHHRIVFDDRKVFTVGMTEEVLSYIMDGSLAIEVYGNRSRGFDSPVTMSPISTTRKSKMLHQEKSHGPSTAQGGIVRVIERTRWEDLKQKLELRVEVLEMTDQGSYAPVELDVSDCTGCAGVFQLRQGYSHRLSVSVRPIQSSKMHISLDNISEVAVGCVLVRNKPMDLDSYQERDLTILREKWSNSLLRRREYLDKLIQQLINKPDKTDQDKIQEGLLIDQWVALTEERNAIMCPEKGSSVPGAPIEWKPPANMEKHIPTLFLDVKEDMRTVLSEPLSEPAGTDALLDYEVPNRLLPLPITKVDLHTMTAVASWDTSIHDSVHLNRVSQAWEQIYLIVRVKVRLARPAVMDLLLRKRIAVQLYKKQMMRDIWKKLSRPHSGFTTSAVAFDVVSHIPRQAGDETEDLCSLAQLAAAAIGDEDTEVGTSATLERYAIGISNVENTLKLERLRQEVVVKEKLAAKDRAGQSSQMRKFASTPNLARIASMSMTNLSAGKSPLHSTRVSSMLGSRGDLSRDFSQPQDSKSSSPAAVTGEEAQRRGSRFRKNHPRPVSTVFVNFDLESPSSMEVSVDMPDAKFERIPYDPAPESTIKYQTSLPIIRKNILDDSFMEESALLGTSNSPSREMTQAVRSDKSPSSDHIGRTSSIVDFKPGDRVCVNGQSAVVRFVGYTHFSTGVWVGLELPTPDGKNDGCVQNIRYFECQKNCGLFVRAEKLSPVSKPAS